MRILLCTLALAMPVATAEAQRISGQPFLPDPHYHVVAVHEKPWETELAPEARVLLLDHSMGGRDSVISPNGRWHAFIHYPSDKDGGRICLQNLQTGKLYEVRGISLPYRPLNDLVWLDNNLLAFDRWSQPHYGIHYIVDVKKRRLVLAAPFPDEFFLRQQRPQRDSSTQHR
ncbi:MAG: hypothetical protein HY276_05035 [Ignavibacteriales bacterium]|nr:hypothetical protein [Ignavibacteriales bacterium]